MAAVATIRAASLDVLFTAKTKATVATVSGLYANGRFIDKLHGGIVAP
jgi:hypothetical protein